MPTWRRTESSSRGFLSEAFDAIGPAGSAMTGTGTASAAHSSTATSRAAGSHCWPMRCGCCPPLLAGEPATRAQAAVGRRASAWPAIQAASDSFVKFSATTSATCLDALLTPS